MRRRYYLLKKRGADRLPLEDSRCRKFCHLKIVGATVLPFEDSRC